MAETRRTRPPTRGRQAEAQTGAPRAPASPERRIEQLQDGIKVQQQRNRELQAQIRLLERAVSDRSETEAELAELKGEIRELTRANREHVKRYEALQMEFGKLRTASRKGQRTDA